MKNMIKVLVIALTSLAFSGVSFAQAKPATPATPAAPAMEKSEKAKSNRLTGEITSVDVKAGTFTVKGKDKEINLVADSKSTKAEVEKLKVGDTVRVSYAEKDGKMIASSVRASKSKAAKPDKAIEKTDKKSETK